MITLNRERGFEKVESWDEILGLAGFTDNLNPEEHELNEIIGNYLFKDKIPCGLSSCHQPHGKGYIVSTKSGLVTNIGSICGKNHFGVDFNQLASTYNRAVTEHNNRISLTSFIFQLEEYLNNVDRLRSQDKGADWINKHIGALSHRNRGCPDAINEAIGRMVRSRNPAIEISREATDMEISQMAAQQGKDEEDIPKPQYVTEQVGTLNGLSSLFSENGLRELVVLNLQEKLKELENFDVDSASYDDLKSWAKWCSDYEQQFEQAESIVAEGRALLEIENLNQMVGLLEKPEDIKSFRNFLGTLK